MKIYILYSRNLRRLSISLLAVIFIYGCQSDYGISKGSKEEWLRHHLQTPLTGDGLSYLAKNDLVREGFFEQYEKDPESVLKDLYLQYKETLDPNTLATLTELTYIQGRNASEEQSLNYFLSTCIYSYTYLFNPKVKPPPTPFSTRFLYMCRFYNFALAEIVNYFRENQLSFNGRYLLTLLNGKIEITGTKSELPFPLKKYKEFLVCNDYIPYGFQTYSRKPGVGIPLIAIKNKEEKMMIKKIEANIYDASREPYPCTLFLRIIPEQNNTYRATFEFFDPNKSSFVKINNDSIPLEIDLTTPFAFMMKKKRRISALSAMFDSDEMKATEGLYLLRTYRKDKIPVVFVHGLMSDPRTWVQMFNTLKNNEKIRHNYQFWFYAYPTGNPILMSAMNFRKTLLEAQKLFDPKKNNPKFNQMILISHSMGGLLSKTTIKNSRDVLIKTLFNKPIDEMGLSDKLKQFVVDVLVFEHLPFIRRVVFMSVPHRGAEMATWTFSRIASSFITIHERLINKVKDINEHILEKTGLKEEEEEITINTGITGLSPDNRALKLLCEIPYSKDVPYHSIIGNNETGGVAGGTDGIVPYTSSHLDGAVSELVVKSNHSTQTRPLAIKEVRRILLKHLKLTDKQIENDNN